MKKLNLTKKFKLDAEAEKLIGGEFILETELDDVVGGAHSDVLCTAHGGGKYNSVDVCKAKGGGNSVTICKT